MVAGPDLRRVGRIVKPHGIRGELVVDLSTDSADLRFAVGSVLFVTSRDGAVTRSLTITAARPHTGRLLVCFEGVDGRDAAEHCVVCRWPRPPPTCRRSRTPTSSTTTSSRASPCTPWPAVVGTVREVLHGAGGELLVVDRDGGGEALVPFVRQIVPEVDVAGGKIVLDPPRAARRRRSRVTVHIDVVTIFPEYLAPLRAALLGRAIDARPDRRRRARPARLDARRAPRRGRQPLRRRPRHGDEAATSGATRWTPPAPD